MQNTFSTLQGIYHCIAPLQSLWLHLKQEWTLPEWMHRTSLQQINMQVRVLFSFSIGFSITIAIAFQWFYLQQSNSTRILLAFMGTDTILFGLSYLLFKAVDRYLSDLTSLPHFSHPQHSAHSVLPPEQELDELKSRFVAMVSHELRTPLTVIRTSAELLEQYSHIAPEEKKQEYFRRIRSAIGNMNQLLEDVLTVHQVESSQWQPCPTWLNLENFCHELVCEMHPGAIQRVHLHYQGNCQQVWIDADLLRTTLKHLLSNALKYAPAGDTVTIGLTCNDKSLVLEVHDRGIGIPLDDQSRLFNMFHRAKNVDTIQGTGLGLAIVKECVTKLQGQITFASQEGVGTIFTVSLPLSSKV